MAGTRQQGRRSGQQNDANYEDRLGNYKFVDQRIVEFYEKHPDGALRSIKPPEHLIRDVDLFDEEGNVTGKGRKQFIRYTAGAFAHKDDVAPKGIGVADEPFPGTTPYTRNSEVMNAETSAWGRAIVAAGIISKGESVASANEVQNRRAEGVPDAVTNGTARTNAAAALAQQPPLEGVQLEALVYLAAQLPNGKERGEEWSREAVLKRFAHHARKSAENPFMAVFTELVQAHEQAFGPDGDHIAKANAMLEPSAEAPAEEAATTDAPAETAA